MSKSTKAHIPPQQVQYYMFFNTTTCSSTALPTSTEKLQLAYFNRKATTMKMANTKNSVTFTHPHTRQMQLPMPSLFLPTISFTFFRFFSKLSIFPTTSGTLEISLSIVTLRLRRCGSKHLDVPAIRSHYQRQPDDIILHWLHIGSSGQRGCSMNNSKGGNPS